MKILVAVKRVVDAKIKVRPLPDHSGVDVKLAKMAMNPFDEIAIEKAVTLREAGVADEVVAVTVGPLKAVDTLRVAMAIGADRAVHVRTDESLEPLAVAKVLHAVVEGSARAASVVAARRGRRPAACGGLAQDACCKLCSLDGRGKASALRRRGGGHALACLSRSA